VEWQQYEAGQGEHPKDPRPEGSIRRTQSCPDEFVSIEAVEALFRQEMWKPGLCRVSPGRASLKAESPGQKSVSTRWSSPAPSGTSASNGQGEDNSSDDLPVDSTSWRRNAQQESSGLGKWNSNSAPTTPSGKISKSWRESYRDSEPRDGKGGKSKGASTRDFEGGTGGKNTLILRGLPYQTTETEVYNFIEENGCKRWLAPGANNVALLLNQHGRASGYAEISLGRQADFAEVRAKLHMQFFGQRYVEVLPNNKSAPGALSSGRHERDHSGRHERDHRNDWNDRRDDRTARSWRR